MIKLLIIDDEPEVRDLLNIMLRSYPDLQVIGQAENVDEGIAMTRDLYPDLVLLDIQMPDKDGFDYLEELKLLGIFPGIIFVTAYENYAIRAIKKSAIDYLLKPIRREELFAAIDRFTEIRNRKGREDIDKLVKLLYPERPGRIKLNTRTGYYFVDPEEVFFIEADGNYSKLVQVNGKKEITTMGLGSLEKLFDNYNFLRISRSYIINMRYISRVDRRSNICELEHQGTKQKIKIPTQKIKLLENFF